MPGIKITLTLRNKMRVSRPIARVLAIAYYGLNPFAGCHSESTRETRKVNMYRAFVMGGLDDEDRLTKIGFKMLQAYAARQTVVAKVK